MNKKLLIASSFLALVFILFPRGQVLAQVTKGSGDLEIVLDHDPMFSASTVLAPGQTYTTNLIIRNKSTTQAKTAQIQAINFKQDKDFAEHVYFKIGKVEDGMFTVYYGETTAKTLKNLSDDGEITLSVIPLSSEKNYRIEITVDPNLINDYQGNQASMDFNIGFKGEPVLGATFGLAQILGGGQNISPTPTPTPTPTPIISQILGVTEENGEQGDFASWLSNNRWLLIALFLLLGLLGWGWWLWKGHQKK